MRVLLSTIGSRGDVQPLVALGLELRDLGHEVHFCVPPDFQQWIEEIGFRVTPIGPAVKPMAATAERPSPERMQQLLEESVATQFRTIATAASNCDLIVGATALQIAAPSIAEKLGIPYVFVAYCPAVLPSPHHPPPSLVPGQAPPAGVDPRELWARNADRFNTTWGALLNFHRAAAGLTPIDDVRGYILTSRPWLAADPALAPWPHPDDSDVVQTGAWIVRDERPLDRELEAFLDAGEPPVYFGFGSSRAIRDLGRVLIESARTLGRRAIISRGWAELSATDSARDCLVIGEVNLQALFPRVAAVVHHGGAGTTTIAALGGAPQVLVPQIYDQHYFAERVDRLGIGTAHAPGAPTVQSLTAALDRTLQPGVADRARAVAATIRRDGATIAARYLTTPVLRA